jgi:hypothetical protein
LFQAELGFDVAQQAGAARMQNPSFDILALFSAALQKSIDQLVDFRANHFRHILGQQDVKSGIPQVKAHGAERVWKGVCFRK